MLDGNDKFNFLALCHPYRIQGFVEIRFLSYFAIFANTRESKNTFFLYEIFFRFRKLMYIEVFGVFEILTSMAQLCFELEFLSLLTENEENFSCIIVILILNRIEHLEIEHSITFILAFSCLSSFIFMAF